eukprot:5127568-Amphidinium_carterae.1
MNTTSHVWSVANNSCRSATIVAEVAAEPDTPTAATVRASSSPGTTKRRVATNAVMPLAARTLR